MGTDVEVVVGETTSHNVGESQAADPLPLDKSRLASNPKLNIKPHATLMSAHLIILVFILLLNPLLDTAAYKYNETNILRKISNLILNNNSDTKPL